MQRSWRQILKAKKLAVDTETTGLLAWKGDMPFAISFLTEDEASMYFEWFVDPWTHVVIPDEKELEFCAEVLGKNTDKIFHNAKFDVRMMEQAFGIETNGTIHDTMFMAHTCNSLEPSLKLKVLAQKYLKYGNIDEILLQKATIRARRQAKKLGWFRHEAVQADYWMVRKLNPENRLAKKYCLADVERTLLLTFFYQKMMKHFKVEQTYRKELSLWPITYKMETRGIAVNLKIVDKEIAGQMKLAKEAEARIIKVVHKCFDLESPDDAGKLVYDKLKLPVRKRTPTGRRQVSAEALMEHTSHPVVADLFKYRAATKALSSFFLRYRRLAIHDSLNEGGFVLHPDFNQVGPATGRYSCRNPNFQNTANALTTRSAEPIQARTPFYPRPGYIWLCIDYEGIEVRIFADVSGAKKLIRAINDGLNAHAFTANKAWGGEDNPRAIEAAMHSLEFDGSGDGRNVFVQRLWKKWDIDSLTKSTIDFLKAAAAGWLDEFDWDIVEAEASLDKKTCYARAKMMFFGKIYGGGPGVISSLIGCSVSEARQFMLDYDQIFPGIKRYIETLSYQGMCNGFIHTRFGRKLMVNPDKSYRAVNYMVQGSAADMLKDRMIALDSFLKNSGLDVHLIMTIHDELVFEIRKEHLYKTFVQDLMNLMEDHTNHFNIALPTSAELVRKTWNQKEKLPW